jgi:hypothetical protein
MKGDKEKSYQKRERDRKKERELRRDLPWISASVFNPTSINGEEGEQ